MPVLEMDCCVEERWKFPTYCDNDPVNMVDPEGTSPEASLQPPSDAPEYLVRRYTEQEWKNPINMSENQAIGKYSYVPVSRTPNPEGVGTAVAANIGRGLRDVSYGWVFRLFGTPFMGSRDRIDYVDVTYKLSYTAYPGIDSTTGSQMDADWVAEHAKEQFVQTASQINEENKYFYMAQFGAGIIVEVVGGVVRIRSAIKNAAEDGSPEGNAINAIGKGNTSHDIGVQQGRAYLESKVGLKPANDWVNPFEDLGAHGQGFDDYNDRQRRELLDRRV